MSSALGGRCVRYEGFGLEDESNVKVYDGSLSEVRALQNITDEDGIKGSELYVFSKLYLGFKIGKEFVDHP